MHDIVYSYIPKPYNGVAALPASTKQIDDYTLVAKAPGGYQITLAKLATGRTANAACSYTAQALFESYNFDGSRAAVTSAKASGIGYNKIATAAMNAMGQAGVTFARPATWEPESLMRGLGEYISRVNPELSNFQVI